MNDEEIKKRKEQDNSVFGRIYRSKYQKFYGAACFILMYSLLLYAGSRLFLVVGRLECEGKRFLSILVVGLIILASSLLSKMFQGWSREIKNREKGNNGGGEHSFERRKEMSDNFKEAVSYGLLFTVSWVLVWTFAPLLLERPWSWSDVFLLGLSSGVPGGFLFGLLTYLKFRRRSKKHAEQNSK